MLFEPFDAEEFSTNRFFQLDTLGNRWKHRARRLTDSPRRRQADSVAEAHPHTEREIIERGNERVADQSSKPPISILMAIANFAIRTWNLFMARPSPMRQHSNERGVAWEFLAMAESLAMISRGDHQYA